MTSNYDDLINIAAMQYLPTVDPRLFKAQLIAESNLNPNAVSPVGAIGVAQFMPDTWQDVIRELDYPLDSKATNPSLAIPAAAYYMAKQIEGWTSPRPEIDRYCLALASYNAGFGNMLDAQKFACGALGYAPIAYHLKSVTGGHSSKTTDYVKRIYSIYFRNVVSL